MRVGEVFNKFNPAHYEFQASRRIDLGNTNRSGMIKEWLLDLNHGQLLLATLFFSVDKITTPTGDLKLSADNSEFTTYGSTPVFNAILNENAVRTETLFVADLTPKKYSFGS